MKLVPVKAHFAVLATAALLVFGPALPGHAEDAAAPKAAPAPTAPQTEAPPVSVARPSLAPKTNADQTSPPAAAEPAPNSDRRTASRYLRFGRYRIAYWKPFTIHWPHFHRHRIHWRRISWSVFQQKPAPHLIRGGYRFA